MDADIGNSSMLLFLSSGARPRYREDIVRTMALPSGGRLQFRYDLSIVDDIILNDAKEGKLVGQRALVCYLWNRTEGAPTEYVPCRFVEIARVEIVGSSLVMVLIVGGYPELSEGVDVLNLFADEDRAKLPRWSREGTAYKLAGLFAIVMKRDPALVSVDTLDSFEKIVRLLCRYSDFSADSERYFFAILGVDHLVRDSAGREGFDAVTISPAGSYSLVSGEEYELKTYVFAPELSPTATIKETALHVQSENSLIEFPLGKSREIDSEYDIKRFRFHADRSISNMAASLILFVHEKHEISEGTREIILPVVFAGRWLEGVARASLIAAGSSVPAMISAYAAGKLDFELGLLMFGAALAAGVGTVLLPTRK
jgi:hypothetical protein